MRTFECRKCHKVVKEADRKWDQLAKRGACPFCSYPNEQFDYGRSAMQREDKADNTTSLSILNGEDPSLYLGSRFHWLRLGKVVRFFWKGANSYPIYRRAVYALERHLAATMEAEEILQDGMRSEIGRFMFLIVTAHNPRMVARTLICESVVRFASLHVLVAKPPVERNGTDLPGDFLITGELSPYLMEIWSLDDELKQSGPRITNEA